LIPALRHTAGAWSSSWATERAKEWAERGLLLDPDNVNLRYNFACSLITEFHDFDAALDLLEPVFEKMAYRGRELVENRSRPRSRPRPSALQGHVRRGRSAVGAVVSRKRS